MVFIHLFRDFAYLTLVLLLDLLVLILSLLVDLGNSFLDLGSKLLDRVFLDVSDLGLVFIKLIHPLEHLLSQDSEATLQSSLGLIIVTFKSLFGDLKQHLSIQNWFHDNQEVIVFRYDATAGEAGDEVFVGFTHLEFAIHGVGTLVFHYRAVRVDHDSGDHVDQGDLSDKGGNEEESPTKVALRMAVETFRGRVA